MITCIYSIFVRKGRPRSGVISDYTENIFILTLVRQIYG